jgi:hypothetical protein
VNQRHHLETYTFPISSIDKCLTKQNIYVWSFSHPISWQQLAKKRRKICLRSLDIINIVSYIFFSSSRIIHLESGLADHRATVFTLSKTFETAQTNLPPLFCQLLSWNRVRERSGLYLEKITWPQNETTGEARWRTK